MLRLKQTQDPGSDLLLASKLCSQDTFYRAFLDDLNKAKLEVIIESPFITARRMELLLPAFKKLRHRGVRLIINTKPMYEHEPDFYVQAEQAIAKLQDLGALVLFTGGHHRKLAVIDKRITWEGSLNILSQNDSCEFMRRIFSEQLANQTLAFLGLEKFMG
jgi:phosphatidylserine/phosphatidylglycerophosphate/cardiolipin synthase-like enzyme